MTRIGAALAAAALLGAACAATPKGPDARVLHPVSPESSAAAAKRGEEAMSALQSRLAGRLMAEMGRGGPAAAVKVCRDEAQALTAAVVAEQGIEIGRSSHRLRNPANAPRPWVAQLLPDYAGRQAADTQIAVVDLGDRIGVVKPLPTQQLCLACHGERSAMAPEVRQMIEEAYPSDEATGFGLGEVRGVIWAEVPQAPLAPRPRAPSR